MKNIINKLVFGSLTVALSSCIGNYENINSNPYEAPDLSADGYALGSAMNNLAGCVVSPDVNTAQFTDCLLGGPLGGYFADSNAGFTETISNFNPKDDWSRVFLKSDKIIPTLYSNLTQVKLVSQNTNDPVPYAIAQVIKVAAMHRVTDAFGPIPYSQVGVNNALKSGYDSQEQVYKKMFEDLDNIIDVLTTYSAQNFNSSGDRIYGGNTKSWAKFANSVKLRMAMRIVYVNESLAKQKAEEAVNSEIGVMTVSTDGAYHKVVDHNPWERFMPNWGDARISADLVCYMNGYSDPRREVYYDKSTFATKGAYKGTEDYVGLRRGIRQGQYNSWSQGYSCMKVTVSDNMLIFPASEVTFLRAEGALRGWNMGGTAKALYEEAVSLSFDERGVSGASTYLTNSTGLPTVYKDPLKGEDGQKYDYSGSTNSTITVAWDDAADFETKLERIITQKWIAIFPSTMEAWSEYRRTGYPKLMPAMHNLSDGVVDDAEGARRLSYPADEYRENGENLDAAVLALTKESSNKKGDTMATRIWWDCKPAK